MRRGLDDYFWCPEWPGSGWRAVVTRLPARPLYSRLDQYRCWTLKAGLAWPLGLKGEHDSRFPRLITWRVDPPRLHTGRCELSLNLSWEWNYYPVKVNASLLSARWLTLQTNRPTSELWCPCPYNRGKERRGREGRATNWFLYTQGHRVLQRD